MSEELSQIQHHQRILITGPRAQEILACCRKVLDSQNKPYDVFTDLEKSIGDGPIVFIVTDSFTDYDPHFVLIDSVSPDLKDKFITLVDRLPKSGTLVYNGSNESAKEFGNKELIDVHKEEFLGDDVKSAAKKLVRRIGINEEIFDESL